MRLAALTVLVLTASSLGGLAGLGACGGKKDGKRGATQAAAKVDPQAELAASAAALAEVNAKIPEELRGKLSFTATLGEKDRHIAIVPAGWESGTVPGSTRPPDAAGLGFMTQLVTGASCDGSCEPKDWAATAEKADFAQFKGQDYTILGDEKLDGGRVVIAKTVDRTYVAAARWKPGAKRYFACHATLDQEIAAAAPAFAAACKAMKILTWD
jgi:hypothetical protein